MITANYNTTQREIYFKAYQDFTQLENSLKHLKEENFPCIQISILGKTESFDLDKNLLISKDTDTLKMYWEDLLGTAVDVGNFYNYQTGTTFFIVGFLTSIFLHKINGTSLATLSSGCYGIFRGLGANEAQATQYLKKLTKGDYILIARGFKDKLQDFDTSLKMFK